MTDNCKRGYAFYTESGQEKSMNLTFSEDKKLEKLNMQFQEKACKEWYEWSPIIENTSLKGCIINLTVLLQKNMNI